MKKVTLFSLTSLFLLSGFLSCNQKAALSPGEAKEIAKEAYIYGFPMVMGYKAMNAYILDKNNPEYKGTFNFLACDARLLTPADKAIVTPNSDTPYCMMWGDIREEPVVISVPEMEPERFYHFQLIDLYTHNFAYVGNLTTGNGKGSYLVTGPDWSGEAPEGIDDVIRCETPFFFVVVRTQLFGPDDLENVKTLQSAYKIEPMSEFFGGPPVPRAESINIPEWSEGDQFSAAIFPYLDALLDLLRTPKGEEKLMNRFAKLGLGKNEKFDLSTFDENVQKAIQEGAEEGQKEIETFIKELNQDPLSSAKVFGTREFLASSAAENYALKDLYLLRAAAAHLGLYGNSGSEAIYPIYLKDDDGNRLDASANQYTITFKEGELPPVQNFWSITMYDGKTQLLVDNLLDRYLVNSTMMEDFIVADDGSLTFYIQKDSPGDNLKANWLPAPDGPLYCVMRLYGPKEEALSGDWKNPPMVKVIR